MWTTGSDSLDKKPDPDPTVEKTDPTPLEIILLDPTNIARELSATLALKDRTIAGETAVPLSPALSSYVHVQVHAVCPGEYSAGYILCKILW